MIFIVCTAKDAHANNLALQMSRVGHHIRRTIVEQARTQIGAEELSPPSHSGDPEPIPETQEEINAQADAALRDLFPRIPNFDKQMIIEHAFKKEADYTTARKVVEKHCLDILVRWRGDEETGRDQFDEILREVVVLSDDSDEGSSDEDGVEESSADGSVPGILEVESPRTVAMPLETSDRPHNSQLAKTHRLRRTQASKAQVTVAEGGPGQRRKRQSSKKANRGFKRYQAVAKRWEEAVNRNRHVQNAETS
ncbi:hypothetical protein SLS53_002082 [Cytospora paraplurivora]|uniref:DUF2293 domain-containing protein n=1 Tax=Cytospora paraplurivora TaxID=2898453 RepID=A0AAN9UMM6_9PEZI